MKCPECESEMRLNHGMRECTRCTVFFHDEKEPVTPTWNAPKPKPECPFPTYHLPRSGLQIRPNDKGDGNHTYQLVTESGTVILESMKFQAGGWNVAFSMMDDLRQDIDEAMAEINK